MHAGTAQAYANDPKAVALTLEGINGFHYAAIEDPFQKTFFFLPLGHSEDLRNQELAVKLADELVAKATAGVAKLAGLLRLAGAGPS